MVGKKPTKAQARALKILKEHGVLTIADMRGGASRAYGRDPRQTYINARVWGNIRQYAVRTEYTALHSVWTYGGPEDDPTS